jgi:hypothetical protein
MKVHPGNNSTPNQVFLLEISLALIQHFLNSVQMCSQRQASRITGDALARKGFDIRKPPVMTSEVGVNFNCFPLAPMSNLHDF